MGAKRKYIYRTNIKTDYETELSFFLIFFVFKNAPINRIRKRLQKSVTLDTREEGYGFVLITRSSKLFLCLQMNETNVDLCWPPLALCWQFSLAWTEKFGTAGSKI